MDRDEDADRAAVLPGRTVTPTLDGEDRRVLHARIGRGHDADRFDASRGAYEHFEQDRPLETRQDVDLRILGLDARQEQGRLDPIGRGVAWLGRIGSRRRRTADEILSVDSPIGLSGRSGPTGSGIAAVFKRRCNAPA